MPGNIFVLGDDGKLIEMRETPYDSEALLQRLLPDYSNLLAAIRSVARWSARCSTTP
jgi:hypothetical protein